MICDTCGEKPAMIHVEGEGDFCLSCYNKRMAARYRFNKGAFAYPTEAVFTDKDGGLHFFRLSHQVLGPVIRWQAVENDGEHEIVMSASAGDPPAAHIGQFYRKIADTLWS